MDGPETGTDGMQSDSHRACIEYNLMGRISRTRAEVRIINQYINNDLTTTMWRLSETINYPLMMRLDFKSNFFYSENHLTNSLDLDETTIADLMDGAPITLSDKGPCSPDGDLDSRTS